MSAAQEHGGAIERLARAYEAEPEHRRDLLQEIHAALWRSFRGFDDRCSVRTWVYRVAHNVAVSHVMRQRRLNRGLCSLDDVVHIADDEDVERMAGERLAMDKAMALLRTLKPLDREVVLLFLERLDAAAIAEVVGISPGTVANKIFRFKALLAAHFRKGEK
jgi:RNA polymerase sigma-70 factor (ECF subfamily)